MKNGVLTEGLSSPSLPCRYMPSLVSIVIPTRNRAVLLGRLLDSFRSLCYPSWEAIVVDDGSVDRTPSVVQRYRLDGMPVRYYFQPWSNVGAARNRGIAEARGELLAFIDDDCEATPTWLDSLAHAIENNPHALGVQGRTVTNREAATPFTRQIEQLSGGQPYRTCNIAYRREVLMDLGGFDPLLIRGEDIALSMRVLERGPIVFAPDAVVSHPPRPKEWADRAAWRRLLASEMHFRRVYPTYGPSRSQTLSIQKPEHVFSRWVLLPVRRYWRLHWRYFRKQPREYLRHVPLIIREKLALLSLLPYILRNWRSDK
jgi:glycosyltransferase involved in cell wall biosynthesis